MRRFHPRSSFAVFSVLVTAAILAGCTTSLTPTPPEAAVAPVEPTLPPSFQPQELVGRWGFAAYHRPDDRARTETAARNQCKIPVNIGAGDQSHAGAMHLSYHFAQFRKCLFPLSELRRRQLVESGCRCASDLRVVVGPRDSP